MADPPDNSVTPIRGLDSSNLTNVAGPFSGLSASSPLLSGLPTSRVGPSLDGSGIPFPAVPVTPMGSIGLSGDSKSSSMTAGSMGITNPASSCGISSIPSAGISSEISAPIRDFAPGLAPKQPSFEVPKFNTAPTHANTESLLLGTAGSSVTSVSSAPPSAAALGDLRITGSALPTASPQLPQVPHSAVSVPQGHVPLIAVGGSQPGLPPLAGASPIPPMVSTTAASMPAVSAPPMTAIRAYQVPHTLTAPAQYGVEPQPVVEAPAATEQLLPEADQRVAPLHHWFYCKTGEPWTPFSRADSTRLEAVFQGEALGDDLAKDDLIPTDGGRYDVDLSSRLRHAVYWTEEPSEVRRCTWFFKDEGSGLFSPYSESLSDRLESEYQQGLKYNVWQRKIELPGGQRVVMHNAQMIVDYAAPSPLMTIQQLADGGDHRPRVVQRGLDETDELEDGESLDIEHLVFVVNGIGGGDAQRNIIQHVDDFRQASNCMLNEHFSHRAGGRVEFLPVSWTSSLRGDHVAVEKELSDINLPSCARLRSYGNASTMDILFYSSPAYCQAILSSVSTEMERILELFQSRHTDYKGPISAVGHSLGACILFDLLSHQGSADPKLRMLSPTHSRPSLHADRPIPFDLASGDHAVDGSEEEITKPPEYTVEEILARFNLQSCAAKFSEEKVDFEILKTLSGDDLKEMGITMGPRKKLLTFLREHNQAEEAYQRQLQEIKARREAAEAARLAAARVRSEQAEADAQREAEQEAAGLRSFTYRRPGAGVGHVFVDYPQLSFPVKSFFALGSPIAMLASMRGVKLGATFHLPTCPNFFNVFHPYDPAAYRIEPLIDLEVKFPPVQVPHHKGRKRLHLELRENLGRVGAQLKKNFMESVRQTWQAVTEFAASHRSGPEVQASAGEMAELERERRQVEEDLQIQELESPAEELDFQLVNVPPIGILNGGQRIDYVLQERPFESFNEYLFSIQSHSSYWTSEDTTLLILRHLFTGETVPSSPVDQQSIF